VQNDSYKQKVTCKSSQKWNNKTVFKN